MSQDPRDVRPDTWAAQAGHHIEPHHGGVVPALELSATFARDADYAVRGRAVYARDGSPTTDHAESVIAGLEGGGHSLLFTAGMSAIVAVFETLRAGDHVVLPAVAYHGTGTWLRRMESVRGLTVSTFDATTPGALEAALTPQTRLVWVETPTNPHWEVIDIAAAAHAAHAVGARLVVDGTVAPPCTTRALDLGADAVFHAATKYLNGHSDLTAGVLTVRSADAWLDEVRQVRTLTGTVLPPFEAWLLVRGLRTLPVRYRQASASALTLAERLAGDPRVTEVLYPGLPQHPGHAIARRQMTGGFGGMLSFRPIGGEVAARHVATHTRVLMPATSLGGVESLIEHRIAVEPPGSPVSPDLLRLSIGLEHIDDLWADLDAALATAP